MSSASAYSFCVINFVCLLKCICVILSLEVWNITMIKNVHLSPEIESRLSAMSQRVGLEEDELILEAIINYLEELEDVKDVQERLSNPPDRYLSLEEVEKELGLAD